MELFTSAWDGDMEGILHTLESGASVNVTIPVRIYIYIYIYTTLHSNNCIRNNKMYIYVYILFFSGNNTFIVCYLNPAVGLISSDFEFFNLLLHDYL